MLDVKMCCFVLRNDGFGEAEINIFFLAIGLIIKKLYFFTLQNYSHECSCKTRVETTGRIIPIGIQYLSILPLTGIALLVALLQPFQRKIFPSK